MLASAAPTTPATRDARLWHAARQFEAMAIGALMKPMFDTVDPSKTLFGGGEGEAAWRPMLVQQIAQQIERAGGLGLAASVYSAMLSAQEEGRTQ